MTTRHHARSHHDRGRKSAAPAQSRQHGDAAILIALAMIGAFAILLAKIVFQNFGWMDLIVGYVVAVLALVNFSGWRAVLGMSLAPWQQSLARLPLRVAGYSPSTGRPLTAAKGDSKARAAMIVFLAASLLIVAGAALMLMR